MADPPPPAVPEERLDADGWKCIEDNIEERFRLPTLTVTGRTLVYEDADLRERLRPAVGDTTLRFFFATRLSFSPPLAPGMGPMIRSTVVREAKRAFAADLEARGISNVEQTTRQRMRVESGDRATLLGYRGRYDAEGESMRVEGWLAVWLCDGFRIAGGAYPRSVEGVDTDPGEWRGELLDLIRDVG
ncbi:hypothetical protein [Natranaeroarchaeum sulfidigenes]|uniref:Uncharacterized protein n=1 Tax=Natranaeroarchaeum sulfidigenes TaxID=2784880 RepID=A0A897MSX3_9EURY|nr:hypothetical protein [Natranaeroarchaeum sulfidigenes]QSG03644.1 Uncharacterized protein AArcS_2448 [Natranaeroarchaeum sulfidigenes]